MKVIPIATLFLILSGCSVVGKIFPGMADDNSKPRIIGDQFPDTDENYDKSGFHLTVETYEDCSALQTMVYEAQKAKLANDWEQTVYYAQFRGNYVEYQEDAILTPSASTAAAESSAEVSKSDSESFTNNQEKGIDEADYIKIGNSQIFVLGSKKIAVSNRSGLQYVGKLDLDGLSSPVMYTPKDRLILAGTRSKAIEGKIETNLPNYSYYNTNSETVVRVYDVAQSQLPKLAKEYVFNGNYVDSRLTKGNLILVMQGSLEFKDDAFQTETVEYKSEDSIIPLQKQTITSDPLMIKNNAIAGVPCQQIVKQPIRDMDFNLTQVASIDVTNLDAAQIKAALGGGEQIYMSNKSLYIIKSGVNWQPWVRPKDEEITDNSASATVSVSNSSYYGRLQEGLAILKADIAADSGGIEFVAAGIVLGQAKDQYSFKEYADGSLAVATTTYMPLPEVAVAADEDGSSSASELVEFVNSDEPWSQIVDDTRGRNHLWVLAQKDKSLEVVRAAKNFGEIGEDIRSVRFMDGYAYIVTFKKTDPLYSFDMSVPSEFKMVGKLKIPGFSMYMHPAGDQIIGVGFDADDQGEFAWYQGIQVSLFDVSDPTNMQRTDNKIHGQRGSSSEVTSDAHAFFYSEEDNIFALPVVELAGKEGNIGSQYGSELQFSGVVLYSIEGEKLQEKGRISHFDFIPSECQSILKQGQWWQNNTRSLDINRVFKVDEKILTISRYGIKQYGLLDFSTPIAMTHFPEADGCSTDAFID